MHIYQDLPNAITCIDTGLYRSGLAACYLLEANGCAAFVDTGTNHNVPRLLELLRHKNIPFENLRYIIPTHVHLDHAGGAGRLMQALPHATLLIHPRGARHMIDPSKLQAGAKAVYGETEFNKTYGELIPVDAVRVKSVEDGFVLDFNGRELLFLDTPGHARHHFCVYDRLSQGFFSGDTFGLSYREFDGPQGAYILPTTTPVQFDPEAWQASLDRLLAYRPQRMYLTHFGMIEDISPLAADLRRRITLYAQTARQLQRQSGRHQLLRQALMQMALDELAAVACPLSVQQQRDLLAFDIELNAQGLEYWLEHGEI